MDEICFQVVEASSHCRPLSKKFGPCRFIRDFVYKEGIYSGSNFKEVIVDAIENSRALIFVSSVNSNASLNVAVEVEYAIRLNKTILPVMLDDAPFSKRIRLDISNIDQIEFAGLHGNESKLITSLKYVLDVK